MDSARPSKRRVRETFREFDRHAVDLLEKMLTLDPSQRISAKDALDAEYFWTDPMPSDPKILPKYESSHEFQTKKKHQQHRQYEEIDKRHKLQHSQQQSGQIHPPQWQGSNHQMDNSRPPLYTGPGYHHYGKARGPVGYYSNHVGHGFSSGPYHAQGRAQPGGVAASASRGVAGAYGFSPPGYSRASGCGGSGAGSGPNSVRGNHNQHYW